MKTVTIKLPLKYVDTVIENRYNSISQKLDIIKKKIQYTPKPYSFIAPIVAGNPPTFTRWFKEAFKIKKYDPNGDTLDTQIKDWYKIFLAIDSRVASLETRNMMDELDLNYRLVAGQELKLPADLVQELMRHSSWMKEIEVVGLEFTASDNPDIEVLETEIITDSNLNDHQAKSVVQDTITDEVPQNKGGRPKKVNTEDPESTGGLQVSVGGKQVI